MSDGSTDVEAHDGSYAAGRDINAPLNKTDVFVDGEAQAISARTLSAEIERKSREVMDLRVRIEKFNGLDSLYPLVLTILGMPKLGLPDYLFLSATFLFECKKDFCQHLSKHNVGWE